MPLVTLFPFLSFIQGRILVYAALIGMAGSFVGGYWVNGKFEQAKQVTAVNLARAKERDAGRIGYVSEAKYLATLKAQEKQSDAKIENLKRRLAHAKPCAVPVPTDWLRQPERVSPASPDAGRARPAGETVDPVADARDVVLTCERNRLEVHDHNSAQIEAMRAWYRDLAKRYNR